MTKTYCRRLFNHPCYLYGSASPFLRCSQEEQYQCPSCKKQDKIKEEINNLEKDIAELKKRVDVGFKNQHEAALAALDLISLMLKHSELTLKAMSGS